MFSDVPVCIDAPASRPMCTQVAWQQGRCCAEASPLHVEVERAHQNVERSKPPPLLEVQSDVADRQELEQPLDRGKDEERGGRRKDEHQRERGRHVADAGPYVLNVCARRHARAPPAHARKARRQENAQHDHGTEHRPDAQVEPERRVGHVQQPGEQRLALLGRDAQRQRGQQQRPAGAAAGLALADEVRDEPRDGNRRDEHEHWAGARACG
ncbi:hypothetical protein T492DRAFT_1090422 [Pavlovales sp. CCMP2436]|nr:hypothetical protein T492DRAFT_1090422 [Pavlovales sp. CCMP2436]|mmetsp:Transcript_24844/g.62888  ORF Transcript_24844/g.62888 Transcript_24844/m.62888 type:complete len:212 (-) Transcript_24844:39-674(-)